MAPMESKDMHWSEDEYFLKQDAKYTRDMKRRQTVSKVMNVVRSTPEDRTQKAINDIRKAKRTKETMQQYKARNLKRRHEVKEERERARKEEDKRRLDVAATLIQRAWRQQNFFQIVKNTIIDGRKAKIRRLCEGKHTKAVLIIEVEMRVLVAPKLGLARRFAATSKKGTSIKSVGYIIVNIAELKLDQEINGWWAIKDWETGMPKFGPVCAMHLSLKLASSRHIASKNRRSLVTTVNRVRGVQDISELKEKSAWWSSDIFCKLTCDSETHYYDCGTINEQDKIKTRTFYNGWTYGAAFVADDDVEPYIASQNKELQKGSNVFYFRGLSGILESLSRKKLYEEHFSETKTELRGKTKSLRNARKKYSKTSQDIDYYLKTLDEAVHKHK